LPLCREIKWESELLNHIESCRVYGVGELACYDAALRIGGNLNIFPEKIYLHAGTRTGARELLKQRVNGRFIYKEDLPEPFR